MKSLKSVLSKTKPSVVTFKDGKAWIGYEDTNIIVDCGYDGDQDKQVNVRGIALLKALVNGADTLEVKGKGAYLSKPGMEKLFLAHQTDGVNTNLNFDKGDSINLDIVIKEGTLNLSDSVATIEGGTDSSEYEITGEYMPYPSVTKEWYKASSFEIPSIVEELNSLQSGMITMTRYDGSPAIYEFSDGSIRILVGLRETPGYKQVDRSELFTVKDSALVANKEIESAIKWMSSWESDVFSIKTEDGLLKFNGNIIASDGYVGPDIEGISLTALKEVCKAIKGDIRLGTSVIETEDEGIPCLHVMSEDRSVHYLMSTVVAADLDNIDFDEYDNEY